MSPALRAEVLTLIHDIDATSARVEEGLERCLRELRDMNAELAHFQAQRHERLARGREV